jgi:hypothetical protein
MKSTILLALLVPALLADIFFHAKSPAVGQYQIISWDAKGFSFGMIVLDTQIGRGTLEITGPRTDRGQFPFHIDTNTLTVIWDHESAPIPPIQNP